MRCNVLRDNWLFFVRGLGCSGCRWRNHNHGPSCSDNGRLRDNRARRRFCGNDARRRTAGNRGSGRRRSNNRRRLTRLRNNLARLRFGGRRGRRWCCSRSGGGRAHHRLRGRLGLGRHAHVARFIFLFLFLGQDCLQHIAGLGDVRQIDFGHNASRALAARCAACRGPGPACKVRANSIRLVSLERAGVRFAALNAQLRKNVENRARLDFQFFREIVNTNLAHPPLFTSVLPICP